MRLWVGILLLMTQCLAVRLIRTLLRMKLGGVQLLLWLKVGLSVVRLIKLRRDNMGRLKVLTLVKFQRMVLLRLTREI